MFVVSLIKKGIKMKNFMQIIFVTAITITLIGCGETWSCESNGKTMYSMSASGKIGSADKGCSCQEIRNFELQNFGKVDEQAMESDFGC
jgi:hypothetical protein